MPTIVTHLNPHLDEVACIWMIRRFLPKWKKAKLKFIPTTPKGGNVKNPDASPDVMYLGVGRGKFDEHKGNIEDSATTLVYKFLIKECKIKLSPVERGALEELVAYVNDEDHGRMIKMPQREFSIAAVVSNLTSLVGMKSAAMLDFGHTYFDGVFATLIEKHQLLHDWKKVQSFTTKWGKGVAIETTASPKAVLRLAAESGGVIAVVIHPKSKFRSIRALNESAVNLEAAFESVRAKEPQAEWYLHHSKKMLICGSDVALNKKLSKIPLKELVKLVAV